MADMEKGTYVRTTAIDQLVDSFLASTVSEKKQIISLGAGTDTRYFRLMSRYAAHQVPNWIYHEMDFAENAARKVQAIKKYSELAAGMRTPTHVASQNGQECIAVGPHYRLHPIDLRTLDPEKAPPTSFESIDPALPTIILSECCLCYLAPAAADAVALYFTKHLFPPDAPLGLIVYEPIKPFDAFGKTMVANLATRGIVLQTLKKYGNLEAQAARMRAYGLTNTRGSDINGLWKHAVSEEEKKRVASLEMVDEVEEWELLAGHYCVTWAWKENPQRACFETLDKWIASYES